MGVWYCPTCGERKGVTEFCSKHGAMKEDLMADPRVLELVRAVENVEPDYGTKHPKWDELRRAIAAVKAATKEKHTMTINETAKAIHEWAVGKGWWQQSGRNIGELIALVHSELSEALEEWREGRMTTYLQARKPCGFPSELADAMIRIMDIAVALDIDLEAEIECKMRYNHTRHNHTRPYRHGGKLA